VEALVTLAATKRFTPDEFMAMPDERDYVLIDGQLVDRELMGAYSSVVAAKISYQLNRFNLERPFGWSSILMQLTGASSCRTRFDVPTCRSFFTGVWPEIGFLSRT
jgi:hypothetical protein